MNERAVDVEEEKALAHLYHVERSRDISYYSSANVQWRVSHKRERFLPDLRVKRRAARNDLGEALPLDLRSGRLHREHGKHAPEKYGNRHRRYR
jgi:hypothetical protein